MLAIMALLTLSLGCVARGVSCVLSVCLVVFSLTVCLCCLTVWLCLCLIYFTYIGNELRTLCLSDMYIQDLSDMVGPDIAHCLCYEKNVAKTLKPSEWLHSGESDCLIVLSGSWLLSDCCLVPCLSVCLIVCLIVGSLRFADEYALIDPLGSFAVFMFYRFMIRNEDLPNPRLGKESWYPTRVRFVLLSDFFLFVWMSDCPIALYV